VTTEQILQLLAQGGIGLVALAVIGKIAWRVAERMITAIDALATETRNTGRATVEALGHLTERLSRLEGKVEILASEWPDNETSEVRRVRARSPALGVEGEYGPGRPPRR